MDDDLGKGRGIWREARTQRGDVGQLRRRKIGGEQRGEFGLAAALVRERQKIDHQPAR
jgi:hypothetical protein